MKLAELIPKEINDLANVNVIILYSRIGDAYVLTMCNLIPICDYRVQRGFSFPSDKHFEFLTPIRVKPSNKLE